MPKFFFDTDDGGRAARDDDGIDLPDTETAKTETMLLLCDPVHGVPTTGKTILGCVVRGEDGLPVHRFMMTFEGEMMPSLDRVG